MKKCVFFIVLIFLLLAASPIVSAAAPIDSDSLLKQSGIFEAAKELDEETKDYLKQIGFETISQDTVLNADVQSIFKALLKALDPSFHLVFKTCLSLLGILLISCLAVQFSDTSDSSRSNHILELCSVSAIILISAQPLNSLLLKLQSEMNVALTFSLAVMPIICIILAAQGKNLSAGVLGGSMSVLSQVVTYLFRFFFFPVCSMLLGVSVCSGFDSSIKTQKAIVFVRKYVLISLSAVAGLYFTVLSVRSGLSGTADEVSVKTLKFASGNFVPVIGSAISDSASVVISALNLTKSTVSGFGMIALIGIFVPVLMETLLWMLGFELCAYFALLMEHEAANTMLKCFVNTLSFLLIVGIFAWLVLFISLGIGAAVKGNV